MAEFYLRSSELIHGFAPRACEVVRRIRSELRDDIALVRIDPPLPKEVYDTPEDLSMLLLASRFEGSSLFPVTEWPTHVYICRLKKDPAAGVHDISSDDLVILDWGKIEALDSDESRSAGGPLSNNVRTPR